VDLLETCRLCCRLVSDTTGKSPTCYGLAAGKLVQWSLAIMVDKDNVQ